MTSLDALPSGAAADGYQDGPAVGDGLDAAACAVVDRDPEAGNPFEVAVALEISGYSDADARMLGYADLFGLARAVFTMTGPRRPEAARPAPPPAQPHWPGGIQLLRGLLYSVPWVAALIALRVGHVSFWSTITTTQFSSTISLALFMSLILTGAAIQAFARRGTFYLLQGNWPLLGWTARRLLGMAVGVILCGVAGTYVLLEWVLQAYTPESNRMFLLYGIAIPALLLGLAPLYMARAFGWLAAASIAGAAFLIFFGRLFTVGDYLDPYLAMALGLPGIAIVVAVAVPSGTLALRRQTVEAAAEAGTGSGPADDPADVRPPRLGAVLRSVAGYAAYGATFFALLIADQLVAGGLWEGHFDYPGQYEAIVAIALLVLIPVLAYVIAAQEQLPDLVRASLAGHVVTETSDVRAEMRAFLRRHLVVIAVGGVIVAVLLAVLMWVLSPYAAPGRSIPDLRPVMPAFCLALLAYLLLAVGAFNSGLLFALNRARAPAVSTLLGVVTSVTVGGLAVAITGSPLAAVAGLTAGSALFAIVTTIVARSAFSRFDSVYYGAF